MPRTPHARPAAEAPASPETQPSDQSAEQPAPEPRPAYAVLRAVVTDEQGGEEELQLAMPAEPFGTIAWQVWAIGLYVARLRRHEVQPSAETLRAHLASGVLPFPAPTLLFPYGLLQDLRPSLLLDLRLGPLDDTKWPKVSLAVIEQDTTEYGFSRIQRFRTLRAVTKAAALEMEAEAGMLAGRAHREDDPGLRELAELAGRLADQAAAIHQRAQQDAAHQNAATVRAALRTTPEERKRAAEERKRAAEERKRAAEAEPPLADDRQEEPLRTVTGHLERAPEVFDAGGAPGLRLYVTLTGPGNRTPWRDDDPKVLICTVTGPAALLARALPAGTALVLAGRACTTAYQHAGDIRRRAHLFEVTGIGVDLAAEPAADAAA